MAFRSLLGREKAVDVGLATLALSFREKKEKGVRCPNVRPERVR